MSQLNCKWVSRDMTTRNNTKWEVGVPKELPERNNLKLCEEGLFHYFPHPLLAVMFKASSKCVNYSKLYEVKPEGKIVEGWNKRGSTKLTLVKELEIPQITDVQLIAFGVLCALEVCKQKDFVSWGEKWLSGKDRSEESAFNCFVCRYISPINAAVYATKCVFNGPDYIDENVVETVYWAANKKIGLDLIPLIDAAMKVK